MGGNNLSGQLPSEVGIMDGLLNLTLSGNFLSGFLPTELGLLASLGKLFFCWVVYHSYLPHHRAIIAEEMRIERNFLSGEIPPDLVGLSNAGELGLYEILFFRIRKLLSSNPLFSEFISLRGNLFSALPPASLSSLARLRKS
jgi:hypothetical protein